MSRPTSALRVGLAQIDCRLGDVEGNLEIHLEWLRRARGEGVELLLFPELSLTGYRLLHLTQRVALKPRGSPIVERLAAAAAGLTAIIGLIEEDEQGTLYNSAVMLRDGAIVHIHRKLYLPTYGIFQEGRFFGEGQQLALGQIPAGPSGQTSMGVLICEDLWHSEPAHQLARGGAKLLAVVSASPGRIGPGEQPSSQDEWELLTRSCALLNTCWVVYCNRVGWEEGSFYTGGSHVVRPGGEVLARAPVLDEHLLVAEIDLRDADRLRWRLPLLRAERRDLFPVAAPADPSEAEAQELGGSGA
jgi:predicted amidohydrolase